MEGDWLSEAGEGCGEVGGEFALMSVKKYMPLTFEINKLCVQNVYSSENGQKPTEKGKAKRPAKPIYSSKCFLSTFVI